MDIHYANARYHIDTRETVALATELEDGPVPLDWDHSIEFDASKLGTQPLPNAEYTDLPAPAKKASAYRKWNKDLLRWVRQNRHLTLYYAKQFKLVSELGETEGAFRGRLAQVARETRDLKVEKLRQKYSKRFITLRDRLLRAEQAIAREQDQVKARGIQTAVSFGSAILGAFLGRKVVSARSASQMGSAVKSASRIQKERMDVQRAAERAESVRQQMAALELRLQDDIDKIQMQFDPETVELREINIKPKSSDITLEIFGLTWMPFRQDGSGKLSADWG
jgi:hypothetical protein